MKNLSDLRLLKETLLSLNGLIIYEDILQDKTISDFCRLLASITAEHLDRKEIWQAYFKFFRDMLGKSWPSYIVRCLLHSRNIFAEQASSRKSNGIDPMIRQSVFWDLAILQKLAAIKPSQLKTLIATRFSNSDDYDEDWTANWPEWDTGREIAEGKPSGFNELKTSLNAQQWLLAFRNQIIQKFLSGDSWSTPENFQILADFYRQAGCGILAEYAAFRVRDEGPVLEGIENPENAALPPMELLDEKAKHTDINKIIIDEEASTVFLEDPEMRLDVGAIAKGYATERVAEIMEEKGISGLLLSVGGNVRAIGGRDEKQKEWNVGIQNPDRDSDEQYLLITKVMDMSVISSGDYERYYTVDGKEYHHIIDPNTLMPAQYFTAVSILCKDSGMGDALSTALFNMSLEEGKKLIESFDNTEALWVQKDEELVYSTGFEKYIKE